MFAKFGERLVLPSWSCQGDPDVLRFFVLVSCLMAREEGVAPVPGAEAPVDDLLVELARLEESARRRGTAAGVQSNHATSDRRNLLTKSTVLGCGPRRGGAGAMPRGFVPDEDLETAIRELARVLVPGGSLMLGGHVGDSTYLKTEGYGGLPMRVLVARRSPETYAHLPRGAGLVVDATIALGPDHPASGAIWLAHKPV